MPQPRLHAATSTPTSRTRCSPSVLERALDAGEESVKRGPELLPVLREAGVVDAGGYGLTIMFAGVVAALRGDGAAAARAPRAGARHPPAARVLDATATARTSRSPARAWTPAPWIERARGDRRLRARGRRRAHAEGPRPHRRPGARRRALFDGAGAVSRLDVADMHEQVAQRAGAARHGDGEAATCGVLAVVSGDGHGASCSSSLGARAARRRPDAEPLDLRAAGRHPRRARPRRSSCCRTRRT